MPSFRSSAALYTPTTNAFGVTVNTARTADTNAYTAGDVIGSATSSGGAVWTFSQIGPFGSQVLLTTTRFRVDLSAVPSGMTSFRLYLYSATPPSALGDNAAFDLPSGDRSVFLGYTDLGTPVDLGSTLYVETSGNNKQITLATDTLYGYLVTNAGYTPASGTNYKIALHTIGL